MNKLPQSSASSFIPKYEGNRALRLMKVLKGLLRKVGPGFITGAADDDPFRYCYLLTDGRDLWVRSALARLVHLSVHDRHTADVQPDRDGNGEGAGRRHP